MRKNYVIYTVNMRGYVICSSLFLYNVHCTGYILPFVHCTLYCSGGGRWLHCPYLNSIQYVLNASLELILSAEIMWKCVRMGFTTKASQKYGQEIEWGNLLNFFEMCQDVFDDKAKPKEM